LVSRIGGGEVAGVFTDAGVDIAHALAERLRESVMSKRIRDKKNGGDLGIITLSVGVAHVLDGGSPPDLIVRADAYLYQAKASGRNCVMSSRGSTIPTTVRRESAAMSVEKV